MISNIFSRRRLAVILLMASCIIPSLSAESKKAEPYGFVRLVNAVSVGSGKLEMLVDGASVREDGYQLGDITGGIPLKPKTFRILFRRDGVEPGETSIRVSGDDTTILIPFAEQVPASDEKPAHWAIRILRLKQHDSNQERTASFISVSRQPELKIAMKQSPEKWEQILVKRLSVARTKIEQSKGYIPVRYETKNLSAISVAASGNHVMVLYDNEAGELQSKTFQDYKYLSTD